MQQNTVHTGRATPEGTANFAKLSPKLSLSVPRRLGSNRTKWSLSPVAFGTHRINSSNPNHSLALKKAFCLGVNVIDMNPVFGNGDAESVVGQVLDELFTERIISRQQIVVVGKAGLIQGSLLKEAKERKNSGPFTHMTEYNDELWYSLSAEFLEDQISRTLHRTNLQTIDLFLLNRSPVSQNDNDRQKQDESEEEFSKAFQHLEKEVSRGRIQYYGICSASLIQPPTHPNFFSLERLLNVAPQTGNLVGIEIPFNLFEGNFVTEKNQKNNTLSVSQLAQVGFLQVFLTPTRIQNANNNILQQRLGLIQLSHRPLNAITRNGQCVRLVERPSHSEKDVDGLIKEALDFSLLLEQHYPGRTDPNLPSWKNNFAWGHVITANSSTSLSDLYVWLNYLENHIQPTLALAFPVLTAKASNLSWASRYQIAVQQLFERYTWMLEANDCIDKKPLIDELNSSCISEIPKLSWKALQASLSTSVDCVVVGMRHPDHVLDIVSFLKQFMLLPPIQPHQLLQLLEQLVQFQCKKKRT